MGQKGEVRQSKGLRPSGIFWGLPQTPDPMLKGPPLPSTLGSPRLRRAQALAPEAAHSGGGARPSPRPAPLSLG